METVKTLIGFCLSIAVFLVSLRLMSESVQNAIGARLRKILAVFTFNPLTAAISGAAVTALVQSSSAVAAVMVALVNAGVLTLSQAFGVILGANVGTTVTAQIAALDLSHMIVPLILCGLFVPINRRTHYAGMALIGLGGLFLGLSLLRLSLTPILGCRWVQSVLISLSRNALAAVLAGVAVTAVVQSSSAVTSVVIVLGQAQAISLVGAIAIAFGSNIGTVLTTLISSIGMNREAKAAAYADLIFNVLGVAYAALDSRFRGAGVPDQPGFGKADSQRSHSVQRFHRCLRIGADRSFGAPGGQNGRNPSILGEHYRVMKCHMIKPPKQRSGRLWIWCRQSYWALFKE